MKLAWEYSAIFVDLLTYGILTTSAPQYPVGPSLSLERTMDKEAPLVGCRVQRKRSGGRETHKEDF
jgi:hypothetical protein